MPNDFDKLTADALRTEPQNYTGAIGRLNEVRVVRLLHVAMGLATEAGEFVDQLKKYIFYGKELDIKNLDEELGDTSWYLRVGVDALETEFFGLLTRNVEKLKKRFPEKFTEDKAINRNIKEEEKVWE